MNRFEQKNFTFEGRSAAVFFPSCPSNGKLMLKTEYLTAFPYFEIAMLQRGYTLACVSHPSRWAPDSEVEVTANFVRFVADEYKLDPKCIMVGMSCGGLLAVRLAEQHPELASVLFLDAPVMNLLSLYGLGACKHSAVACFKAEMDKTYGFTPSTVINFRKSPIDNMKPLIDNNIPIIMIYGDADDVVIYEENGKLLEDYYKENSGDLKTICIPGRGHHPHSLAEPSPIIEYVEAHLK